MVHTKKIKRNWIMLYINGNLKWINIKAETIKFLEENPGINFHDLAQVRSRHDSNIQAAEKRNW
jgi:hypothetical protein